MAAKSPRLCADQGVITRITPKYSSITFKALPYPLPEAWRKEFRDAALNHRGDFAYLEALEIRARESIGFEYTRQVILPMVRA